MRNYKFIKKILVIIILLSIISCIYQIKSKAGTDEAGLFLTDLEGNSIYARNASSYAAKTFQKLGYNIVTTNGSDLFTTTGSKSTVMSYINSNGKNYGFYVLAHGVPGAFTMHKGDLNQVIKANEISGNWHLVFIDACSALSTSEFANAFKTTSAYSNRAILGWFNDVTTYALHEYWPYFYEQAGTTNLRQAALNAAGKCQSSTPIRFYGDASWYGWAW